jgi:hypothetical protein
MNLVASYQLGGAALWTLGMEDPTATTAMRNVALAIAPDTVLSSLTVENTDSKSVNFGDVFNLRGVLTLKDMTPIAGLEVSIEMKRENETSWSTIAKLITAADGSISTPIAIGGSTAFRLTTIGTWERAESTSNIELVTVRPKLILERPSTVARGNSIQVKGTLLPRASGAIVTLQQFVAGKWQNIKVSSVTDSNGEFIVETAEATKGIVVLRVQIVAGKQEVMSPEFSVVVR